MYRMIFFGGVILVGGIFLWDVYRTRQPVAVANNLSGAFERGYVPADEDMKDKAAQVLRPTVHSELVKLLRPAETDTYALVVGAHGTGKVRMQQERGGSAEQCGSMGTNAWLGLLLTLTVLHTHTHARARARVVTISTPSLLQSTAVRKAARDAPAKRPNGVVYFNVKDPQGFSKELCEVLGFVLGQLDGREAVRRKVMGESDTAESDPATEPLASWRPLARALHKAAKEFRCVMVICAPASARVVVQLRQRNIWCCRLARDCLLLHSPALAASHSTCVTRCLRFFAPPWPCPWALVRSDTHGVPMTLVIDNTQDILGDKPEFVTVLQKFAKAAADSGNLQVVFVSSDFTVLTHMQGRSEWSRCAEPLEIGESDVSEQAAVDYLMTKLRWPADAHHKEVASEYCRRRICGSNSGRQRACTMRPLCCGDKSFLPHNPTRLPRHLQRTSFHTSRVRALRC